MPIATRSDLINISSEKKTEELAKEISKRLNLGHVVFFEGEMGVGKTTFIRYLINYFQKKNQLKITEVTSPTFNLLNEYKINEIKINHYDLFRIKDLNEIKNLGLFEDISKSITLIEWPEKIKLKPKNLIELKFKYGNDYKKRTVQVKGLIL